ncbi:glycosyltransferase family 1 protein [Trametes coccinea BRFM310]|uniref:Glycosyltransferase family 1 protein n=1 Tax=Trametes coccinea (strain BRFM310) TaxID=1353009 RepID=A0A1Y2I548_TRAC3|nr:glycosyltransferase family 1 protein [Trametes coccinea BRFM310]
MAAVPAFSEGHRAGDAACMLSGHCRSPSGRYAGRRRPRSSLPARPPPHPHRIFWPFEADQPLNAVRLTEHFSAAYELLEVCTGLGLKPLCRNGKAPAGTLDAVRAEARDVLKRALGEEGAGKRAKALQLREAVRADWEEPSGSGEGEGGASWRDFRAFVGALQAEE